MEMHNKIRRHTLTSYNHCNLDRNEPDHYATLGLDRGCTLAEIRAAYRLLAKRDHPDVNGGSRRSVARAQDLNAAYEILSDPARRRTYDHGLAARASKAPRMRAKIERNISHEVRLRIEDLLRGTSIDIHVNDPANPNQAETYTLAIPAETAPGTRFLLPRPEPFQGGFVKVRVRAFPGYRFKARGFDLRCDLRINSRRAATGGNEMILGPAGSQLRIHIPPRVARGEVLRISGEGMPKPRGGRGDLLVRITYRVEVRTTRS